MRELNHHASQVIRAVKEGETVEVTERNRPVARIVPVGKRSSRLEELVRQGLAIPASAPWPPPPPLPLPPGAKPPSEIIHEMREEERF